MFETTAAKRCFRIVFILALILALALGAMLLAAGMLPTRMTLALLFLLLLIPFLLLYLQREEKEENRKKGRRITALVLLSLFCAAEIAGLVFLGITMRTLRNITGAKNQVTVVRAYVKEENPAQSMEDALQKGFRFGVLTGADSQATAVARQTIQERLGMEMTLLPYAGLPKLIDGLEAGETDGLLISDAYLGLLDSLPAYEGYADALRPLGGSQVEVLTPLRAKEPKSEEEIRGTLQDPRLWKDSLCVYISGIDVYGPVTAVSRSDVNILAVVNRESGLVLLVSTPRDYYVPFPNLGGERDKLTHAGVYGIDASMQTLGDFYGIPAETFFRVNFSGFQQLIDALGGVDVESEADFTAGGYRFSKGVNHLDGAAALAFSRERHAFREDDRVRGRHQMAVIRGVIQALASPRLLRHFTEISEPLSECFQTNASAALLGSLIRKTLDGGGWVVLSYSVDGEGDMDYAWSLDTEAFVMRPYEDTVDYARQLMLAVISGEPLSQKMIDSNAPKH